MKRKGDDTREAVTVLPCPFCGSPAEIKTRKTTHVACTKCSAITLQKLRDRTSAIRAWNSRSQPEIQNLTRGVESLNKSVMLVHEAVLNQKPTCAHNWRLTKAWSDTSGNHGIERCKECGLEETW